MNENRALSEQAMLDSLHDIRLPAEAAGGVLAELAVSVGFAGVLALGLLAVLRLLSLRAPAAHPTPPAPLEALKDLPDGARRVALLHLLRTHAPARYADLRDQLYRPDTALDLDQLEAEIAQRV